MNGWAEFLCGAFLMASVFILLLVLWRWQSNAFNSRQRDLEAARRKRSKLKFDLEELIASDGGGPRKRRWTITPREKTRNIDH